MVPKIDSTYLFSSAIIQDKQGKILLLKRSKNNHHFVDYWQLPEGKIEHDESPKDALRRELKEEINAVFKKIKLIKVSPYLFTNNQITVLTIRVLYLIRCQALPIVLSPDHSDFIWEKPKDITKKRYSLVPGLIEIIEQL